MVLRNGKLKRGVWFGMFWGIVYDRFVVRFVYFFVENDVCFLVLVLFCFLLFIERAEEDFGNRFLSLFLNLNVDFF